MKEEILRIQNVSKAIDGVLYLDNINFHIYKGEILGLLSLNYHGRDQLIDIISQNSYIGFGRIYFDEELVNYYEYSNMSMNKVHVIDHNIKLVEDLSVIDNIHVLNLNYTGYIIREKKIKKKTDELIRKLGFEIDTSKLVSELSIFERAIVELIKAVINGAKLIVVNEISSFLGVDELYRFQKLMEYYTKEEEIAFLYIANHHEESFQICDRVCIFETGKIIKVIEKEDYSDDILKPYVIDFQNNKGLTELQKDIKSFEFKDFTTKNLKGASFSLSQGECITILAIDNNSIQDIEQIINGTINYEKGEILLYGYKIEKIDSDMMLSNKIAFIPENPVDKLLFYDMSYLENLTFLMDYKLDKSIINRKMLKNIRKEYKDILGKVIDTEDIRGLKKRELYELIYYRMLLFNPKVVFITQPFSNADMYLRGRIIELINILKENGISIVILAVNLSDTLNVSDRLLVMQNGQIQKKYCKDCYTKI